MHLHLFRIDLIRCIGSLLHLWGIDLPLPAFLDTPGLTALCQPHRRGSTSSCTVKLFAVYQHLIELITFGGASKVARRYPIDLLVLLPLLLILYHHTQILGFIGRLCELTYIIHLSLICLLSSLVLVLFVTFSWAERVECLWLKLPERAIGSGQVDEAIGLRLLPIRHRHGTRFDKVLEVSLGYRRLFMQFNDFLRVYSILLFLHFNCDLVSRWAIILESDILSGYHRLSASS